MFENFKPIFNFQNNDVKLNVLFGESIYSESQSVETFRRRGERQQTTRDPKAHIDVDANSRNACTKKIPTERAMKQIIVINFHSLELLVNMA